MSSKTIAVTPNKVFRKCTCSCRVYNVPPGGEVAGLATAKYKGTLQMLAFMSGVAKHFEVVALAVNDRVIPRIPLQDGSGAVWNVAGIPVEAGWSIIISAKNRSPHTRPFCFQLTEEVADADWTSNPDWKKT